MSCQIDDEFERVSVKWAYAMRGVIALKDACNKSAQHVKRRIVAIPKRNTVQDETAAEARQTMNQQARYASGNAYAASLVVGIARGS